MNGVSSFVFKKFKSIWIGKKIDFGFVKVLDLFCSMQKKKKKMWFLEIENFDLCLSHEIKSFGLKNIISIFL